MEDASAARIDVLAVGELLLDLISGPGAEDVGEARGFSALPGGSVGNFASTCARLGLRTTLVACVGADRVGDRLVREVEAAGVDASLVERTDAAATSLVLITRSLGTPDSLLTSASVFLALIGAGRLLVPPPDASAWPSVLCLAAAAALVPTWWGRSVDRG